jgi:hypothetical protein
MAGVVLGVEQASGECESAGGQKVTSLHGFLQSGAE